MNSSKPWASIFAGMTICVFLSFPCVSRAETSHLQVSLFHPLQFIPDNYSIDAFRLDLIYGVNQDLRGVDLGLVNEAGGSVKGFELGADNRVSKDFSGVQIGLFNQVKWEYKGVQLGLLANITGHSCDGVQVAIYNDAQEDMRGLQFGIVNHSGSLYGVQIGLINFNDDERHKGFMPFINAAF